MANLQIFGRTFNDVSSISAYDTSNVKHTFTEGGGITTEQLNVSAAGTYTAPTGTAYSPVVVPSGSVVVDDVYLGDSDLDMSASVNSSGLVTYTALYQGYTDATVSSGYVSGSTSSGILQVDASKTYQLPTQSAKTITPSTQQQTAVTAGKYTTGAITVDPIPSQYIIPTGTVNITSNGTVDVSQYASANVNVSSGITPAPLKDVNFIDYDGTCLYSYTLAEFAALTELPPNPSHEGLVSNGWMYTLQQAQAQAASDGKLYVGHLYKTTDGRTRIKIRLAEGRLSPYLGQYIDGTATVDWGDGSATSTVTGSSLGTIVSTQHTYPSAGEYIIYIAVNSGRLRLGGNANYGQVLWANETASATRTKNAVYMIGITELNIGDNCQIGSTPLYSAIYAKLTYPSYEVIGTSLYGFGLGQHLPPILCLPYGMTALGNYAICNNFVREVQIPDTVTSIGNNVFQNCYAIASLIIPSSVTSIGTNCFSNCYGLAELHFKSATPPTVANSNAFTNLPTDCKIYVPQGSLSAYTSATNYPSSSTYTYVEE